MHPSPQPPQPPAPPFVLVVDDHLDTCEVLVRLLRRIPYEAICALGGRRALEVLATAVPALIFLDVMMPDVSGLDVLRAVREGPRTRDVPVVMYSADTTRHTACAALELGAQAFVVKGRMGFNELRQLVGKYLSGGEDGRGGGGGD